MQINLLPDLVLKRRHDARVKRLATLALIGWVALIALVTIGSLGYTAIQKARLADATGKYDELDKVVNSPSNVAFRADALEVQNSLKALDNLFNNQAKMSVIVTRLSDITPKGVRLKEISLDDNKRVVITGLAGSYMDVSKFVAALKESKPAEADTDLVYFDTVALGGANLSEEGVSFNLTSGYIYPLIGASNEK